MPLTEEFANEIMAVTRRFDQEGHLIRDELNQSRGSSEQIDALRHSAEHTILLNLRERVDSRIRLELEYLRKHGKQPN